jgi:DNA primase catalytic core, N-terminal domain
LAAGERITTAARRISHYLDQHLQADTSGQALPAQPEAVITTGAVVAPTAPVEPDPRIQAILLDAEAFYTGRLAGSWAPAYLHKRGLTAEAIGEWHVGYAPRGWTTLHTYLRGRGYQDGETQAAGLARTSSRGTLIDHFRDRVMLPVHDEQGNVAGFIGRARPGSGPGVPKYLNTPETCAYKKGNLLFGLHQASDRLTQGATPVIAEGPFDAIAITLAGQGRYAGLAPAALPSPARRPKRSAALSIFARSASSSHSTMTLPAGRPPSAPTTSSAVSATTCRPSRCPETTPQKSWNPKV